MTLDFINELALEQATIPPMASRLAGFFLVLEGLLIVLRKKNNPQKDIWDDLSNVLLAGLAVFLFPEFIRLAEVTINRIGSIELIGDSPIQEYMRAAAAPEADDTISEAGIDLPGAGGWLLNAILAMKASGANPASYLIADYVLKPLADFVNTLCFPTYWIIRAVSLKIVYWVAPLILVLGAMPPFRSLWKHWFMLYIALLLAGPALILANNFCEECFSLYIAASGSPILGFIMIALARFKAFQAVLDLCYKIFRV